MIDFKVAGYSLSGIYKGSRIVESKPDKEGQTRKRLFVGVAVETTDAYGDKSFEVIEAAVSDKLAATGILQKLHAFEGKWVTLPVWFQSWKSERSHGITVYVANSVDQLYNPKAA